MSEIILKNKFRNYKVIITVLLLLIIIISFHHRYLILKYPIKYSGYVEKYSAEYGVDKYFVYAVIRTESSFKSDSVSNVGARGLMQIMEDTFDWVNFKLSDQEYLNFDSMFDPEINIKYGCYLLSYLGKLYDDKTCVIAAYHAGSGKVSSWLKDARYSEDGKILLSIPIKSTAHYVNKINNAYRNYVKLYKN